MKTLKFVLRILGLSLLLFALSIAQRILIDKRIFKSAGAWDGIQQANADVPCCITPTEGSSDGAGSAGEGSGSAEGGGGSGSCAP